MVYYAHSQGPDRATWQLLGDHLNNVASLSAQFAERFSAKDYGRAAGLLHDLGKYSEEFQRRLGGASLRVDHSTAGAQEAVRLFSRAAGTLLAYVVAGHHSGLANHDSAADERALVARLARRSLPDYSAYKDGIPELAVPQRLQFPIAPLQGQEGFSTHFFVRMLYSCLVDADWLDTERALDSEKAGRRGSHEGLSDLAIRLDSYMGEKYGQVADTPVNRARARILRASRDLASGPPGLYTLTVPTGGGKTLASLTFGLKHAVEHGLERIVYVIPFTSIIEQNAAVFREALGASNVLEHHSNFQYPDEGSDDWDEETAALRLATENWDTPIVVTTNVQFFESLFSNRSSRCRKLHNLARSVVILDEAQMLPTHLLRPSLAALWELSANYGTTVVLCTATQPALQGWIPRSLIPKEIAPDPPRLFEELRRVRVSDIGQMDDASLAVSLREHRQALCIVNARSHARALYNLIRGTEGAHHLSARMCAVHRAEVLGAIRLALQASKPCRVVSTQVVEAGVDVDFPIVFRASAGLDSIAQAAGRCNREGHLEQGQVFVFQPVGHPLRGWFQLTASVAEMVLRDGGDPLSPLAITRYFTKLYEITAQRLDREGIMMSVEEGKRRLAFPFAEIAGKFRVIESDQVPVVVPFDDRARQLTREAAFAPTYRLLRELQPYVVQVYPNEFTSLERSGRVRVQGGMIPVLVDESCYDREVGLQPVDSAGTADDVLIF